MSDREIAERALLGAALILLTTSCNPVLGTGPGQQADPRSFLKIDPGSRSLQLSLIAGYPAGDYVWNYDGYADGTLVVTVPSGWRLTVVCDNRATVPNSCAVVADGRSDKPLQPDWSTPNPEQGIPPGQTATFSLVPLATGRYRIASLVGGAEASGMWATLDVAQDGNPSIRNAAL